MDAGKWEALARRRVQHYGHVFSYTARSVDREQPAAALPAALQPVLARVLVASGMPVADQLTVNEYAPGVGLSAHVDTHSAFGDTMASLSLAGPAVVDFRRGCNPQCLAASQALCRRLKLWKSLSRSEGCVRHITCNPSSSESLTKFMHSL